MKAEMYCKIEQYMRKCMNDSVHDCQHIFRVLYMALDIGMNYDVDRDVLVAASLLHDIGRDSEYNDSTCNHAVVGGDMAFEFLLELGWNRTKANYVRDCILTHRYREESPPKSIEAKILFDADKLDISGGIGIARTLQFGGIISEPLYTVDCDGRVCDGSSENDNSFFHIVQDKLFHLEDKLYTNRAKEICKKRTQLCLDFYKGIFDEVNSLHNRGLNILQEFLNVKDKI